MKYSMRKVRCGLVCLMVLFFLTRLFCKCILQCCKCKSQTNFRVVPNLNFSSVCSGVVVKKKTTVVPLKRFSLPLTVVLSIFVLYYYFFQKYLTFPYAILDLTYIKIMQCLYLLDLPRLQFCQQTPDFLLLPPNFCFSDTFLSILSFCPPMFSHRGTANTFILINNAKSAICAIDFYQQYQFLININRYFIFKTLK